MKKGKITDRFVKLDIYKPVNISKWKASIVSVFKGYCSKRVCGDYKQEVINAQFPKLDTFSQLYTETINFQS